MDGRLVSLRFKYRQRSDCNISSGSYNWKWLRPTCWILAEHNGNSKMQNMKKKTFFVNFQMFFYFRREITEKGLKWTKKLKNGWKKLLRPAFGCAQLVKTEGYQKRVLWWDHKKRLCRPDNTTPQKRTTYMFIGFYSCNRFPRQFLNCQGSMPKGWI